MSPIAKELKLWIQSRWFVPVIGAGVTKPFDPRGLPDIIKRWARQPIPDAFGSDGAGSKSPAEMPEGAVQDTAVAQGGAETYFPELSVERELLDEAVFSGLADMIGGDKAAGLARRFAKDLTRRFADTDKQDALRVDAHTIVSSAGMLGFKTLSESASALEQACEGNEDLSHYLRQFLDLRQETGSFIATRFGT